MRNGVNVLQSNLESGLAGFESGSFDYVILSQTLQAVRHTERIIGEMLRVGRQAIVTFPNFGLGWERTLDPDLPALTANMRAWNRWCASVVTDGKGKVHPVAHVTMRDERLPASYANFYIANGVVLVPTFNDRNDRIALNTIAELMPDRHVVGVHAVDLVWGFGTLHCLTQQQPAGRGAR